MCLLCLRVIVLVVSDEVMLLFVVVPFFVLSFLFLSSSLDARRTGDEIDGDSMVRLDRCVRVV